MRVGADNHLKLTVTCALALIAVALTVRVLIGVFALPNASETAIDRESVTTDRRIAHSLKVFDPTLRNDRLALTEATEYAGTGRNIFSAEIPVSRTNSPAHPSPPLPAAQSPLPVLPTLPLTFFGFATIPGDANKLFLSEEGNLFIAKEGEIINRRYKLLRVTPTSVEMEDLINHVRQTLPLGQGVGAPL